MEELKIEILNPKAMQLIKGMEDLNLIKISEDSNTLLKEYLNKMRLNTSGAPDLDEITEIINEGKSKTLCK